MGALMVVRSSVAHVLAAAVAVAGAATIGAAAAHPVAADGCSATPPAGGLVQCSGVLNNSLNGISIHILGH